MAINKDMNLVDPLFEPVPKAAPSRDGFGKALVELGETNPNVWVLTADVSESTRTHWFAEKFPKRFVQIGVAEQNLAGVAAGIAACGKTVFVSAYAVFSPGRNWDQIRVSVCYNDVPVKFHGSHTGLTVGPDGASHQALEDIAIMRVLPNMVVIAPADQEEARKATIAVAKLPGGAYIRTCREKMPVFTTDKTPFEIGKANVYRDGKDVTIIACGECVYESLKAAEELMKEGIDAAVIDLHTIKPIDEKTIIEYANRTGLIVTVESHQINGGMGSAVAEIVSSVPFPLVRRSEQGALESSAFSGPVSVQVVRHGIHDTFCESGESIELLKKYGLDAEGIATVVKKAVEEKKGK